MAQKPGGDADPERARWRERAIPVCVAELRGAEGLDADALEAICGCAAGRAATAGKEVSPPLDSAGFRARLGGPLIACAVQERREHAAAVARWLAGRPSAPPVVAAPPGAAPTATDKPPVEPTPASPGLGLRAGDGLEWPRWLSGLPAWTLLRSGCSACCSSRACSAAATPAAT